MEDFELVIKGKQQKQKMFNVAYSLTILYVNIESDQKVFTLIN